MTVLLKVCALALTAALFGVLLRFSQSALTLPLQLAAVMLVLLLLFFAVGDRLGAFFSLLSQSALPESLAKTLFKGAAVCLTAEFCASLCREAGSSAAADAVSFAGRLLTVVLSLPLCEQVIETVQRLIG